MKIKKLLLQVIGLALTVFLLSGCGGKASEPTAIPTPVPPTATQVIQATPEAPTQEGAQSEATEAASGFITGQVHGQSPPTPPMVVYAVDIATGAWTFTETQHTDGAAPFTLEVPAGTYRVFAFSETGPSLGYASEDGWSLGTVTVAAGQTVSDIMVRPPSQSECGSMFGLPASPDGRFEAVPGPSAECRAALMATATAEAEGQEVIQSTQPATIIELPDGTRCSFAGTGATLAFKGKRLNYTCEVEGQEVGLLGELQPGEGVWTVEKAVIGHNDSGFTLKALEQVDMIIARIELADGTQCLFAGTGATLAFDGKRLNYTCEVEGQEVGLLGDLRPSEGVWTAEKAVIGHGDSGFTLEESGEVAIRVISGNPVSSLANPASVFCEENGGRVEIRTVSDGEVGFCVFPDGSECEEWTFFRGECAIKSTYQTPSPEARSELVDAMSQTLGMAVTTENAPFRDYISGEIGAGWQATAIGTGLDFENFMVVAEGLGEALGQRGWEVDFMYAADGPTGTGNGFRKGNALCLLSVGWEPSPDADCPTDQPISVCELSPEQQLYTIMLNCAQDITAATTSQSEPEPVRIQFASGAISAQVQGDLAPNEVDRYVLNAMAGQEMRLNLSTGAAGDPAAILVIWGADGTVLISDHADATAWVGLLPATQDYYVDVRSLAQASLDYTLEVIIPPPTSGSGQVPDTFQPVLGQLESTGVPLLLPAGFSGGKGLPPVYPHLITVEPGEYEISLGFGADCRGAGACHYGSLAGKKVESSEPVSTRSFEFDAARAQTVTLANGIEGYFVEGLCGANCDDSKVFWISDGFEYMVGMKAGGQPDVVNLANAVIENSVPQ
jgi:putative hemolysin